MKLVETAAKICLNFRLVTLGACKRKATYNASLCRKEASFVPQNYIMFSVKANCTRPRKEKRTHQPWTLPSGPECKIMTHCIPQSFPFRGEFFFSKWSNGILS